MVTVTGYNLRQKEGEKSFITLQLEGGIDMVQSSNSGRFYATVRRCNVSSTFDEATAKRLVGSQIHGNIVRVECEPYEYTVPESGELITLGYQWDYTPEENTVQKEMMQAA